MAKDTSWRVANTGACGEQNEESGVAASRQRPRASEDALCAVVSRPAACAIVVVGSPLPLSEVAACMAKNTVRLVPLAKDGHLGRLVSKTMSPDETDSVITSGVAVT